MKLFVLVGKIGSGKDHLVNQFLQEQIKYFEITESRNFGKLAFADQLKKEYNEYNKDFHKLNAFEYRSSIKKFCEDHRSHQYYVDFMEKTLKDILEQENKFSDNEKLNKKFSDNEKINKKQSIRVLFDNIDYEYNKKSVLPDEKILFISDARLKIQIEMLKKYKPIFIKIISPKRTLDKIYKECDGDIHKIEKTQNHITENEVDFCLKNEDFDIVKNDYIDEKKSYENFKNIIFNF